METSAKSGFHVETVSKNIRLEVIGIGRSLVNSLAGFSDTGK